MRRTLVVFLMGLGLIIFFVSSALGQEAVPQPPSLLDRGPYWLVPLGEDFAPAPSVVRCGNFLLRDAAESSREPAFLVAFVDRFRGTKLAVETTILFDQLTVELDARNRTPHLWYRDGGLTAELWVPAEELTKCACLQLRLKQQLP